MRTASKLLLAALCIASYSASVKAETHDPVRPNTNVITTVLQPERTLVAEDQAGESGAQKLHVLEVNRGQMTSEIPGKNRLRIPYLRLKGRSSGAGVSAEGLGRNKDNHLLAVSPDSVVEAQTAKMTDEQVEDIIRRSFQYVAMYNVNNKGAEQYGGWNTCDVDTQLKDHTLQLIARPNNDSLYITCMLDLRKEPVILDMPAFDSKYVSLMVTGYDHYVNVPMSTRKGDF
ncbi:DUF1254 domain-containing protein [Synechococcus sp. BSF8S]|uniref:DUF1254 domain-containing protein n=1 Tax=Synechococcales TaxID=1890424 RepID=UPI00162AF2FA|nr:MULTISPECIES: DUF1254 domain-containing protein [unclassified Synechococcus]MBC1262244.1 DUF1254 domain-containing protein [Synechococcus sp. BSF8S]MBC1265173.1 DUF1254 domain-containing protein [Synechococcus sp. BSA11S]